MIHYFNGGGYTLCWELPFGLMAVEHTARHEEVTCPACLKIMGGYIVVIEIDLVAPALGEGRQGTSGGIHS